MKEINSIYIVDNLFSSKKNEIVKINSNKIKNLKLYNKFHELLKQKQINVITHMKDFDGIGSAALLVRNYKKQINNIFFTGYKKSEILNLKNKVHKFKNNIIIIDDIGVSKRLASSILKILIDLKKNKNIIIWLDHHEWDYNSLQKISKKIDFLICNENKINCAAELIYLLLCNKDKYSDKLIDLIHIGDFNLKTTPIKFEISEKMSFVISNICSNKDKDNNLKKLVYYISNKELENKFINKFYKNYLKEAKFNLKLLDKNISVLNIKKYKFAIGFSKNLQNSFACSYISNKTNSDISIFYNSSTSTFHLRSKKLECLSIAKKMQGGGHPYAAAFESNKIDLNKKNQINKTVENLRKIIENIY